MTEHEAWESLSYEERDKITSFHRIKKGNRMNICLICDLRPWLFIGAHEGNFDNYYQALTCSDECAEYWKLLMC